jgi:choline dehydrogenase
MQEFDYIVIGGGSASRLTNDPNVCVLTIQSGHRDDDRYIHIPATFFKVIEKERDALFYASEREKGPNGRPSIVPQGHRLGGGRSINAVVYIHGSRQDYDTWAEMVCRNWSYDKVLPVFRDVENNRRLSDEFHGYAGEPRSPTGRSPSPLLGLDPRRPGGWTAVQRRF